MNKTFSKKEYEGFLLEQFLKTLGLETKNIEEREAPDFLVRLHDREIGVELTTLFIHHRKNACTPQAHESISDKIVSRAQQIYQKSSAPPAHISLNVSTYANLSTLDIDDTAKALSNFVRNLNLTPWQVIDWRPEDFEDLKLSDVFAYIHALGVPDHKMALWTVARSGWSAPLKTQPLQTRIDEKSKKLKNYQQVVAENWLVITTRASRPSQMFYVPPDFNPSIITSPFSKTFYFSYLDKTLIRLGG